MTTVVGTDSPLSTSPAISPTSTVDEAGSAGRSVGGSVGRSVGGSVGRRKRIRRGPAGPIATTVAIALTAIPVLWMLLASVKTRQDLTQRPLRIFPSKIIWGNYRTALTELPFFRFFFNSLVTTVLTTAIKVVLGVTTAYALVFLKFRFQRLVFWFVVASLMVPFEVVLIPNYVTTAQLGWLDSWMGIVIPTAGVAFGAYLLHQNFRSIPTEIIEAAQIDGVSKLGLLTRIVVPMSKPTLAAFALITAVSKWNDYLWPRLITSESDNATLPLGLTLLRDSEGVNEWGPIMAGAVLVILPAIPLVLFAQRRIVEGLTGGVKG
jgi:sn-glycerol 3-phosphate transport system permease protein